MPDKIAGLVSELDRLRQQYSALRQQYSANPTDWRLGTEVARAEQAWRHHATAERREADMEAARKSATEAATARAAYKPLTDREWLAAVPATCPACGGATHLHASRIADRGWLHRQAGCEREFTLVQR